MLKRINITCPPTLHNKVSVIKAIRCITGVGLKEAKDMSENVSEQTLLVQTSYLNTFPDPERELENQLRILRTEGIRISGTTDAILEELRQLAKEALEQEEDELANEIFQLVMAEKLRRPK